MGHSGIGGYCPYREVGVGRGIVEDALYGEQFLVVLEEGLADGGVPVAKVFIGGGLAKGYVTGLGKDALRIALQPVEGKYFKEGGVSIKYSFFLESLAFGLRSVMDGDLGVEAGEDGGYGFQLRKVDLECIGERFGDAGLIFRPFGIVIFSYDAIDLAVVRVKGVEAELISYDHEYGKAAGDPQGEPKNVDEGKNLVISKIPEGDEQIILDHN
jgi:hypothetical protein